MDRLNWIEELRHSRQGKLIGGEIFHFQEIGSTNRRARECALEGGKEGVVILADLQTQGKGRLGRSWDSPPGVNLYASILLRPEIAVTAAPLMNLLAGVAGARGLARVSGLEVRIKWPNDLWIRGKKAAGILSEVEAGPAGVRFLILGIGVNINWEKKDFPLSLRETATSLREEGKREFSRAQVANEIFEELEKEYPLFLREGLAPRLREEWNRLSDVNGKWVGVTVGNQKMEGRILGLGSDGALLLQNPQGAVQRLIAGEISLRTGEGENPEF